MRPTSFHAFACVVALVALASVLPAGRADAQCITSPGHFGDLPVVVCDGSPVQLCGPPGMYSYEWSGPGVTGNTNQCITVSTPGRYWLFFTDPSTGEDACFRDVMVSPNPQATIEGPAEVCNGATAQLSGPSGDFNYAWTGPGGFSAATQIVNVGVAGTYQLVVTNSVTGCMSQPATHALAMSQRPTASINGPTAACAGSSLSLCGPVGNWTYAWSGPGGFSASSQCVSVGVSGSYQLTITDNATGCVSLPASHSVSFTAPPSAAISGPSSSCAGSVTLSGPSGNLSWAWSGPDGFSASAQSVTVSVSGTYQLVVTDLASGCSSQAASHTVALGSAPVASIGGPSETCPGRVAQLCGPEGSFGYTWTGPYGLTHVVRCIQAAEPGEYTLVVTDLNSGCVSAPVSKSVGGCAAEENCPRPTSFWRRAAVNGEAGVNVPNVARAVDHRANFFRWGTAQAQAYTNVMKGGRGSLANLAARQYAAMWSNVVATECNVVARGRAVALHTSTPIRLAGVSTTVGEWLAATDAQLSHLAFKSERDNSVRQAYRKILVVGLHVNHGFGIGKVCSRRPNDEQAVAGGGSDAESDEASLAAELEAELGAHEMELSIEPNPSAGRARIRFTVASSASSDVQVGVFDLAGRQVRELASGSFGPGVHEVEWDGRDDRGGLARNGVYFVLTRVDGRKMESRLTMLR